MDSGEERGRGSTAEPRRDPFPSTSLDLVPYGAAKLRITEFPWVLPEDAGKDGAGESQRNGTGSPSAT